MIIKQFAD